MGIISAFLLGIEATTLEGTLFSQSATNALPMANVMNIVEITGFPEEIKRITHFEYMLERIQ